VEGSVPEDVAGESRHASRLRREGLVGAP
jgi:hypothetical protein